MQSTNHPDAGLVSEFLFYAASEQGRRPQTVYKYGLSFESWLRHLAERQVRLVDAHADDMRAWVHEPLKSGRKGEAPSLTTVKRKTCELRSLYGWLCNVRQLTQRDESQRLSIPTVHNEDPKPAPERAWVRLWGSDLELSDRVAFGIAYFCGLRRAEIVALGAHHFVDVPEQRLTNFERKGGKKMSLPWVSCALFYEQRRPDLIGGAASTFVDALNELRRGRVGGPRLLPWAEEQRPTPRYVRRGPFPEGWINPNTFNKRLGAALAAAGLEEHAFSPHQMRHSFGTNMLRMGMPLIDVSRLMGHSNVSITQRYIAVVEDPFAAFLSATDGATAVAVPSPWG